MKIFIIKYNIAKVHVQDLIRRMGSWENNFISCIKVLKIVKILKDTF